MKVHARGLLGKWIDRPLLLGTVIALAILTTGVAVARLASLRRTSHLATSAQLEEWYRTGHRYGAGQAAVKIVQFGSYGCGFCRDFHFALDSLRNSYPDQVGVVWIHSVGEGDTEESTSLLAAYGSECAARQGQFEAYHEALFEADRFAGSVRDLTRLAHRIGVSDSVAFEACLDARTPAEAVRRHNKVAKAADLPGTPVWYLNGRRHVGAATFAELERMATAVLR